MSKPQPQRSISRNRKARHEYELLDRFEAGLVLTGTEVKSLRSGKASLQEAYVRVENGEAFLVGANIPPYTHAGQENHQPTRRRKLLLSRRELQKLKKGLQEKGLTIVPLHLYFQGAWVKLEIALARGKKHHDKRQSLKSAQDKRDMDRALRRR
jgi:SsrA-binding protein